MELGDMNFDSICNYYTTFKNRISIFENRNLDGQYASWSRDWGFYTRNSCFIFFLLFLYVHLCWDYLRIGCGAERPVKTLLVFRSRLLTLLPRKTKIGRRKFYPRHRYLYGMTKCHYILKNILFINTVVLLNLQPCC